jgi:quercetin dioxygenase-like cupin family protein
MSIKRNGSQPSIAGPPENFTGRVRIDPLFQAPGDGRFGGAAVTFEPGARSAWHTHPCGQTLIVTAGLGWTQCWGEPKQEIRPGDVVTCPPGKKHWHGATLTTAMTHIAIQESLNGKNVDWLEKVTEQQYLADSTGTIVSDFPRTQRPALFSSQPMCCSVVFGYGRPCHLGIAVW